MLALYLIYLLFVFKRIVEIFVIVLLFQCSLSSPHCFVLSFNLLLFNFQGPSSRCRFSDLYIISYLEAFVKRFCKSFFNFFQALGFRSRSLFLPTLILYHILSRLSRGFRKVFWSFFKLRFAQLSSLTAYIVYHTFFSLSRVFSHFFEFVIFASQSTELCLINVHSVHIVIISKKFISKVFI